MFVMRKKFIVPTGTYGMISWKIRSQQQTAKKADKQVISMWSAPFSYVFNPNISAAQIAVDPRHMHSRISFEDMLHGRGGRYIDWVPYNESTRDIMVSDNSELCICGTMSNSHKATIEVIVYPVHWENLADNVQRRKDFGN